MFNFIEGQQVTYSETPLDKKKSNLQNKKKSLPFLWDEEKSRHLLYKVKLSSTLTKEPLYFTLDSWEFVELCQVFTGILKTILLYAYSKPLYRTLYKQWKFGFCLYTKFFLHLRAQTLFPMSVNECIQTAEIIIHHKEILIQWKNLLLYYN